MKYTPNTLAMYRDIFDDALGVIKEALWSRAARQAAAAAAKETAGLRGEIRPLSAAKAELAEQLAAANASREAATAASGGAGGKSIKAWQAGLGGGAIGAGGAGLGYLGGKQQGAAEAEDARLRTRNISFGTGLAAGVAAPHVIQGLGQIARGAGSTGLFPSFQSVGQY